MRILLDCDGVLADWTGAVARVVEKHGEVFNHGVWFDQQKLPPASRNKVMSELSRAGFCYDLEALPGAIQGVKDLVAAGCDVHFVTSLWNSPTWAYDRQRWLQKHGLLDSYSRLVFAKNKWVVKGDILVDDKISNVEKWAAEWPNGIGICWAQPWNTDWAWNPNNRFNDWQRLLRLATTMKENDAA